MMWRWIDAAVVLAIHDQQIAEHGGGAGVRDLGLLESALARPEQLVVHENPDLFDLAATYAHGIVRNHPFVDGNKRTAYVVCMLFLRLHGGRIEIPGPDRVIAFEQLGKGAVDREGLAGWLRARKK
ncbi:death-on-curing family protein [Solidesulfovibrio fructosivorans JJ]]|uniref:Death-on-curing family protein n=1 Tax=Solidesulfovibrio fructosivorans JJ] TaxID=596151 RepID=E1JWT6_SOLFR|nr:type II toxin-antitoxin system death-on-curing family toxin [Solidesulfovibrio fructosivorans]EFL51140.1 death-on-curing family protein [Solidesulfovibrio fructosivorans JJ]]